MIQITESYTIYEYEMDWMSCKGKNLPVVRRLRFL